MARKKVPIKDKAIIKRRLAEGKSLREAIKGTVVKSPATARKIAKQELNDIEQIRENYLLLIESFGASEIDRAELWARMTRATKFYAKKKMPDWQNRKEALKYIDSLRGITEEQKPIQQTQVNIFTRLGKEAGKYIEGEET